MDEEDIQEQEASQALLTNETFSGLGSTGDDSKRQGLLMGILRPEGDTVGVKLLRKMGWRAGQGVGAKIRRGARINDDDADGSGEKHHFAPANTSMISFSRKVDRKGLGFRGEDKLEDSVRATVLEEDEDSGDLESLPLSAVVKRPTLKPRKGGIGVGVLNDDGSDDEDPFAMGPRISHSRLALGGKKKEKKKPTVTPAANPLLKNKPVFLSKKAMPAGFRKCHDGRLPLAGFVLSADGQEVSTIFDTERFPLPVIPDGWKSSRAETVDKTTYQSTSEAAKASKMDPKARAALLGEAQLPSKSVFDFLSPAARDRIANATGKTNLPAGLGEAIPTLSKSSLPSNIKQSPDSSTIPELDKNVALAALGRGIGGWTPYADNPAKLARYRGFLEFRGGLRPSLPTHNDATSAASTRQTEDTAPLTPEVLQQELHEFAHAARVFKPMTGLMASRFTTSTMTTPSSSSASTPKGPTTDDSTSATELIHTPTAKPKTPAEEAAAMGMFGPLTRSILPFAPTRLVCKRFGVRPPAHVQPDAGVGADGVPRSGDASEASGKRGDGLGNDERPMANELVSQMVLEAMMREAGIERGVVESEPGIGSGSGSGTAAGAQGVATSADKVERVDAERNEALEGNRAGEMLFKSIFGDDDEDE
jgi:G patch domain-containing protein 1